MNRKAAILILAGLLFFTYRIFAQNNTFLTINPQGHKAELRSVVLTADKKFLLSAGDDKVVRVWNLATGEVEHEIYGEVGEGFSGSINSIALSPDNKLLAVTAYYFDQDQRTGIRIYDFETKNRSVIFLVIEIT
jgi:WD40 repeat protein